MEWTDEQLVATEAICNAATPGPWHYYPCGDKSNVCLLGCAVDDNNESPPAGIVELHPYDEATGDYEMDKYILDPVIASMEDDANYSDFAFMAHARTALPLAVEEIRSLREENIRLRADRDACIKFIKTEMSWCHFRDEFPGDNVSVNNARKLEEFLDRYEAAEAAKE